MQLNIGEFGYFEATTGNGKATHNEWSHHFISGLYEVTRVEADKIWLRDEGKPFPVMRDRITKFERKPKNQ